MAKRDNPEPIPQLPLSRERVLDAALSMADREGIEALSMRKLAQELGVKAMSLYNHVTNKDDILDGIVDIVISEIERPDLGLDWKIAMRRRSISAHAVLLCHPWMITTMVSRVNKGAAMLHYVDATLGCLNEAGFSLEMADYAWNAIDSHIYGFTLQELNFPFEPGEYAQKAKNYISLIPVNRYPYLNQLAHYVMEGRYNGVYDFEFGLDLILDGLDQLRKNTQ
ncbi:MAG: TetR/AcrR family transcriptional regulator [Rivularia sp. T60_A2020_040]|nr:TetR/AcrR family transcriptional regulator [Rivularia sp. T60_A2020_040]